LSSRKSQLPTEFSVATIRDSTGLSEREAQIAYHAVSGKADREIATSLFLSIATVRTHLRHIYRKLGVSNRSSLCRRLSPACGPPAP
jgi:DNA-binding CsgD family transcriptional regulator